MHKVVTIVGPADHGRQMTLDEFDQAEGTSGSLYELSRGVVTVVDVPGVRHFAQVNSLNRQFRGYDITNPGRIYAIAGGSDCKILLQDLQSERHPDVAVYMKPPPEDENVWAIWVPEIVVEVISPGSEKRDYEEKPEEYLQFGISEYWVVDGAKGEMLVHRRVGGRWRKQIVRPTDERYQTQLLPGFALDLAAVFAAR